MSDLKKRIIQKMQEGGSVTYRGSIDIAPARILYNPDKYANAIAKQAAGAPQIRRGGRGSSGEGKNDAPELYNSHKTILTSLQNQFNIEAEKIDGNPTLHTDQKAAKLAQLTSEYRTKIDWILNEGTQTKIRADKYQDDNASKLSETSSEPIIDYSGDNPLVLAQVKGDEGRRGYAFMNPYDIQGSSNVEIITIEQALGYLRDRTDFAAWLMTPGEEINLLGLIRGTKTLAESRKNMKEVFEDSHIFKAIPDTDTFLINGKTFDSAQIARLAEETPNAANPLTEAYLKVAPKQDKFRFVVEAATRPDPASESRSTPWVQYLNNMVLSVANIETPTVKAGKTDLANKPFDVLLELYSGGSAYKSPSFDQFLYFPTLEEVDDKGDKIAVPRTLVTKTLTGLPNGAKALDPNIDKNTTGLIRATTSELLMTVAKNGDVQHNIELEGYNMPVSTLLRDNMNESQGMVDQTMRNTMVDTRAGVGLSYIVKIKGGNAQQNKDAQNMSYALNAAINGSVEILGQKKYGSLIEELEGDAQLETMSAWDDNKIKVVLELQAATLKKQNPGASDDQIWDEIYNNKERYLQNALKLINDSKFEEAFTKKVVKGDWFNQYLISKKGMTPEMAKETAARWKDLMANEEITLEPQISVTMQAPLYEDLYEKLVNYQEANLLPPNTVLEATPQDLLNFGLDEDTMKGVWTYQANLNTGTNDIQIMAMTPGFTDAQREKFAEVIRTLTQATKASNLDFYKNMALNVTK